MSCVNTIVINAGNTYTLDAAPKQVFAIQPAVRPAYSIQAITRTQGYEWGTIVIDELTDRIYSEHFKRRLGPILWLKGAPVDWQLLGVVQETDGDGNKTGYLVTTGWGTIKGTLRYQYR